MAERDPQGEYTFKHSTRISLDGYNGVCSGLMELNDPVADGFMRVSDMRGEIVIIKKSHAAVSDYDQVGNVRVGKFLQIPRFGQTENNDIIRVRKEGNTYLLAVDDQSLSEQVIRENDGNNKFDDAFIDQFKVEINRGLGQILRREKLLNGGKFNIGVLSSYYGITFYDCLIPLVLLANDVPNESPENFARALVIASAGNSVINTVNVVLVVRGKIVNSLRKDRNRPRLPDGLTPDWEEPFIKHSIPEIISPPVPIDRLIRGSFYLSRKGRKIISSDKSAAVRLRKL